MTPKQIDQAFGTWGPILREFVETQAMDNILQKAVLEPKAAKKVIWPETKDMFNCFKFTPYEDLVAVWIGQDPYPGTKEECVATGICMGMREDAAKIPPTLKVLTKELQDEYPGAVMDYTLKSWARQGILMMNTTFTVEAGSIGSHIHLWKAFTTFLLQKLSERKTGVIYICLGKISQEYLKYVNKESNYFITAPHPAAEAYSGGNSGFYGSNIFKRINEIHSKMYGSEINFGQLNSEE